MIVLVAATAEQLQVEVTTPADPSSIAPEFAVGVGSAAGSWVSGTWINSWDPSTRKIVALSPLVGTGQALNVSALPDWKLWIRWHVGTEIPERVLPMQVV